MIRVEFKASSRHVFLPEEQAAIRAICDRAELEAREHLPGLPLTLCLTVEESSVVIPEYGSSGAALDRSHMRWRVDASRSEGVIELAELHLRATLFHELHHLARGWVKVSAGTPRTAAGARTSMAKRRSSSPSCWTGGTGSVPAHADESRARCSLARQLPS